MNIPAELNRIDVRIATALDRIGAPVLRYAVAIVFIWVMRTGSGDAVWGRTR